MASPKVVSSGVAANCLVIAAYKSTLHSAKFARLGSDDFCLAIPALFARSSILMASPKVASSGVAANCLVIAADKSTLHSAKFARLGSDDFHPARGHCMLSHSSAFCEIIDTDG
jgi:hypothetical protein